VADQTDQQQQHEPEPTGPAIPESIAPYVSELRSEAAAHRVKAREAEQQRDAFGARIEAMQRTEAERIATSTGFERPFGPGAPGGESGVEQVTLAQAADLWLDRDLADVLDEEGNVDPAKVSEAVSTLVGQRPGMGVTGQPVAVSGGGRRESPNDRRLMTFGEQLSKAVRKEF
jgi:hypothetical protein